MKKFFKLKFNFSLIVFIFVIAIFFIYFITSAGKTPFDYFTRLSDAFLAGKYYLSENPLWLNELVPDGNKFYVVYPPMPAILALPFRYFLGEIFQQQFMAHFLGAAITLLMMLISYKMNKSKSLAIWVGILTGLGNIMWYLAATGSSWYLGQISAAFFITAALYESLNKKRAYLVGIFLGAAYLSRVQTILSLPLFLYFFSGKDWIKNYFTLAIGLLPFGLFNFYYNFIRFGVVWDKAYILIPGVLDEPWYQKGLFHPSNIPNHLKVMFTSLPIVMDKFPYIKPSWAGLSILITTPAFLYSLFNNLKDKKVLFSWISVILIALINFSHGGTGFTQFGYRYAVDFYPLLIFLTIVSVSKKKLSWHHWLLMLIGVLVNLWGVLWINKFGWVSF